MHVTLGRGGLVWDGEEHLVLGAEVHYWRIDPTDWDAVLDTVARLGFTAVSTYVPWAVHEDVASDGTVSFGFDGGRDVGRFLGLVAERGLAAIVRIGPDTACEQADSGWSPRVLADPAVWARRPGGEPYLLVTATGHCHPPSYASTTFLAEVRRWYEAVVSVLAPLQHPAGPIVACQVDNELGYHFQANSYAMDHHPDFVDGWRRWVARRRGATDPYGTGPAAAVDPPGDGADEPAERRLDWVAHREEHRIEVLRLLAGWARELGMNRVPLQHNDYPRTTTPMDAGRLERDGAVDWAAIDVYTSAAGGRFVRDVARQAAGSTRLPFLAELGAGWLTLPWLLPMATTALDEEHVAMRALWSGFKAVNVYQLVERDRWYGSPVDRRGVARPDKAALYPRLRALLDEAGWLGLRRQVEVLVLENRDEARRSAALDTLADVVPCFSQLLPLDLRLTRLPDPDGSTIAAWEQASAGVLDQAGVDADRATTSCLPDLGRYAVVVVPHVSVLDGAVAAELQRSAAGGSTTVVTGPRPAAAVPAAVVVADPAAPGAAGLAAHLPSPWVPCDDPAVDLHLWEGGGRRFLAAFESSGQARTCLLDLGGLGGAARLRGLWRPEVVAVDAGAARVDLPAHGVQVWEVEA